VGRVGRPRGAAGGALVLRARKELRVGADLYVLARLTEPPRAPLRLELDGRYADRDLAGRPASRSFAVDWRGTGSDILFHFNPRGGEDAIVLNSFLDGRWGEELRVQGYPFPDGGDPFRLVFDVTRGAFRVSLDGRPLCELPHRKHPRALRRVTSTAFLWPVEPEHGRPRPPELLLWGARWPGGIRAAANPPGPFRRPLRSFRFFAVLGTWLEEDVVEATVASCFRQGCERVYLVDNASSDRTVERAVAAGAIHARTFESERYDELERVRELQAVVDEVSRAEGERHVWWLFLDADELYEGPRGLTVREHLESLDRRFRIVGARYLNHLPEPGGPYDAAQPLCYELAHAWYCPAGHWKHPLVRWDRDRSPIVVEHGFHTARCDVPLVEPAETVVCHHIPYRDPTVTRRRLEELFRTGRGRPDDGAAIHMDLRLRSLDAIYEGRFGDALYQFYPPGEAPDVRPCRELLEAKLVPARLV
jgi:hypothetical protein